MYLLRIERKYDDKNNFQWKYFIPLSFQIYTCTTG